MGILLLKTTWVDLHAGRRCRLVISGSHSVAGGSLVAAAGNWGKCSQAAIFMEMGWNKKRKSRVNNQMSSSRSRDGMAGRRVLFLRKRSAFCQVEVGRRRGKSRAHRFWSAAVDVHSRRAGSSGDWWSGKTCGLVGLCRAAASAGQDGKGTVYNDHSLRFPEGTLMHSEYIVRTLVLSCWFG